jgi:pyridoxal phosphate enzyme (YggS family)
MSISSNLQTIRQQIEAAEQRYHRTLGSVKLLAVSKGQTVDKIKEAMEVNQYWFGENYLQEALAKISALPNKNIEWHFIGTVQSNKTKAIAENFSWVHSVSTIKIAKRLNDQRPANLAPLNVCIEVNVSQETNKSGVAIIELDKLAFAVDQLPRLKLRGLMAIPAAEKDFEKQRIPYRKLFLLFKELQQKGLMLDTLSMGMSNDFEAAIAEGSSIVRIGTLIFGPR